MRHGQEILLLCTDRTRPEGSSRIQMKFLFKHELAETLPN
jgi:hypothetical protein